MIPSVTRVLVLSSLLLMSWSAANAQLSIPAPGVPVTQSFSSFDGTGFAPSPTAGQLDSDDWIVLGFSSGDLNFGDTSAGTDYGQGTSSGGETSGGVYAFDHGAGDFSFGVQPTSTDFSPGSFVLRVQNNTGAVITQLDISYEIWELNNASRANSFNFSHSGDNISYTPEATLDYTTVEATAVTPAWVSTTKTITLTGLSIPASGLYYFKWTSDDVSGSGSRDEFAIDDVSITAGGGSSVLQAGFVSSNTCNGDTMFFSNVTTGGTSPYTYVWNFGDGTGTSTAANPAYTYGAAGSYNVMLTVIDSALATSDTTISVTVHVLPTIITTGTGTICDLDSANISASGGVSYLWDNELTLTDATVAAPQAFPAATTTYTVAVVDSNMCEGSGSVTVTIDASNSPRILGAFGFCTTDAPQNILAVTGGGVWGGTGIINTSSGTFAPGVVGSGLYNIGYTTTGACGATDSARISVIVPTTSQEPFFSEYIEGSSNNKMLELYNPGDTVLDLSHYILKRYTNGTANASYIDTLVGTLNPGETYVIGNAGADPVFLAFADTTTAITFYSGNDAVALFHDSVQIDVIGEIGQNPGASWPVGTGSTSGYTLVRSDTVLFGTTVWAGTGDTQWEVFPEDDWTNLGWHEIATCFIPTEPVTANFSVSTECESTATQFTDLSVALVGTITSWAWDFGDNAATSTLQNPAYTYTTSGSFTATLIVTTDSMDSDTVVIPVTVNPQPQVSWTTTPSAGCAPLSVSFTNTSTIASGSITTWAWDLDSATATTMNATTTYTNGGSYVPTLTATSDLGCSMQVSGSVSVNNPPIIDVTNIALSDPNCGAADGSVVGVTATGAGTLSYLWQNASMVTMGTTADLINVPSGNFRVIVTDSTGCTATSAYYTLFNTGGPAAPTPGPLAYFCDGDAITLSATGTGGTLKWYATANLIMLLDSGSTFSPTSTVAGLQSFYVTETGVCEGPAAIAQVYVNPRPEAEIWADATAGCAPLIVNFSDSSTIALGGYTIDGWAFGNGNTSASANPQQTFSPGTYTTELYLTSDSGCTDTASIMISAGVPPTVDAGTDTAICVGSSTQLNGSGSGQTYSWSPVTGLNDPNILNPVATPTVQMTAYILTVADSTGCSASDTVIVTVEQIVAATIDPAGPFCHNGALEMLTASPTGGSWSGNGIIGAGNGTFSPGSAGVGIHTITYTPSSGCATAATIDIEVVTGSGTATDLFFSEYTEGTSNNKALEIYNPLSVAVNLADYVVLRYNNGGVAVSGSDTLSGMLQPGEVYVIANPSASPTIIAQADLVSGGSTFFNGDDALELVHGSTVIDVFGEVGNQPAGSWTVGTGASAEFTLVRQPLVASGTQTWFGDGENTWDAYPQNDWSFLGWHNATTCSSGSITAGFSVSNVCDGNAITATDQSATLNGTIQTWAWDFGDGATSTMQSPTHTYASAGTYTLSLIVTDDSLNADTATQLVNVYELPAADFTVSVDSGCTPLSVQFTNGSTIGAGTLTYAWNFGDNLGTATTANPTYVYNTAGTFTVQLTATSNQGCVDNATTSIIATPGVSINASGLVITAATCGSSDGSVTGLSASGTGALTYTWENASQTVVGSAVNLTGVTGGFYTLEVADASGCANTSGPHQVFNSGAPAAPAVTGVMDYCEGDAVGALTAISGGGTITWYSDQFLTNVLGTGGTFTPTLVLGANNYWATETTLCESSATMVSIDLNPTPVSAFTVDATAGCEPFTAVFSNQSTISSGTMTYTWAFGDGLTSTQQNPTHVFSTFTGLHTVSLLVTSNNGCTATHTETDYIEVYPSPTAGFNFTPNLLAVTFNSLGSEAVTWAWDFGDGNTSTSEDPAHTYAVAGTYSVVLTITSADGCSGSVTQAVSVVSVGIDEAELASFIGVFPNPSAGLFTIDLGPATFHNGQLELRNVMGELVHLQRLESASGQLVVNLDNVANGTYFLRLSNAQATVTKRIVIAK